MMDKDYDIDHIRRFLEYQGIEAVIPPRAGRKMLFPHDKKKYRMRQKAERFFCRIKEFRRIATRYDRLARTSWPSSTSPPPSSPSNLPPQIHEILL